MIQYYFDRNTPEKSVVIVDLADAPDVENIVTDIYCMVDSVIKCVSEKYIEKEWQRRFTDELKELLADMLYEHRIS